MRTIRGRVAALKWAYFTAAAVDGYTVTRARAGDWTVTGTLVPSAVDAYKLAQRPLFFVAPFKRGAWRWEIQTLTRRDGGGFAARLGPVSIEGTNGITRPTAGC
jgi:hypothetical protein